jgi:2,3-dihydroxybenzoate-AMP ligase/mycobactin salicyl-AMP ligase
MRWWLGLTWGDLLDRAADLYPRKIGLVDDVARLTYRELREKSDRLALGLLGLGLEPKDRVLIQLPNWWEYACVFFALQKMGAIPVLLLPRHSEVEVAHLARLSSAKAWILTLEYGNIQYLDMVRKIQDQIPAIKHIITVRDKLGGRFERMEDIVEAVEAPRDSLCRLASQRPDPMEVAQIMLTGGTTGLPKAVARTHNSFLCNVEYHSKAWEITSADTVLTVAPVSHGQGMFCGIGGAFFNYAKLVLLDSTKPADICRAIEKEKVTALPTVPALVIRLLNYKGLRNYDLRSLTKVYAGGAPSTPDMVRKVWDKLGCAFFNAYGSVEGTNAMTRSDDDLEVICNTVGVKCCPYEDYRIVDARGEQLPVGQEGELVSKGPGIFTGYLHGADENSKLFTSDGYFRTGDFARFDRAGNITITGRIKDIILRGGENISATEIENLICQHEAVEFAAVIGMPDEELGERICAYVQLRVGGGNLRFKDVIGFLKSQGASVLQLPERIEFVDNIPLTKVGKVNKKVLRKDISKRLGLNGGVPAVDKQRGKHRDTSES